LSDIGQEGWDVVARRECLFHIVGGHCCMREFTASVCAVPTSSRVYGVRLGVGGAVSVMRTLFSPVGITALLRTSSAGALRSDRAMSPLKPSRRMRRR
jgi:hypothetical protein